MAKQSILRKGNFDAAHRIVNHPGKCANLHGHSYLFEVELEFDNDETNCNLSLESTGYAIDFGDVKGTVLKYIDDIYDHGAIYNPADDVIGMVNVAFPEKRYVEMYLNGVAKFCNPSVENIALQLLIELKLLFDCDNFIVKSVKIHETPQCWTVATLDSLPEKWLQYKPEHMIQWKSKNL